MRLVFVNFEINPINCGIKLIFYDTIGVSKSCQPVLYTTVDHTVLYGCTDVQDQCILLHCTFVLLVYRYIQVLYMAIVL